MVFVLAQENAFSLRFRFRANTKSIGSSVLGIFKIVHRLRDRHIFMWQSLEILNVFNALTLKQVFWKTKICFKKLGYRFLVGCTDVKSATLPYKTALSEANIKTNRLRSTIWTHHKNRSFASSYFICFFENFVSV